MESCSLIWVIQVVMAWICSLDHSGKSTAGTCDKGRVAGGVRLS